MGKIRDELEELRVAVSRMSEELYAIRHSMGLQESAEEDAEDGVDHLIEGSVYLDGTTDGEVCAWRKAARDLLAKVESLAWERADLRDNVTGLEQDVQEIEASRDEWEDRAREYQKENQELRTRLMFEAVPIAKRTRKK